MATLTGRKPSDTYQGLLKVERGPNDENVGQGEPGLVETLRAVQDGVGNSTPLQLSRTAIALGGTITNDGSGPTNQVVVQDAVLWPVSGPEVGTFLRIGSQTGSNYQATWDAINTSDIPEGTNQYWTQARFNAAFSGKTTADLPEGPGNQYFTDARARSAIGVTGAWLSYNVSTGLLSVTLPTTTDIAEGVNLYWTDQRFNDAFDLKTSDDLSEGIENLYYTDTRARGAISVSGSGIAYNPATGVLSVDSVSAAGSQDMVQFKDAGGFGASSAFTFNAPSNTLTVGTDVLPGTITGAANGGSLTLRAGDATIVAADGAAGSLTLQGGSLDGSGAGSMVAGNVFIAGGESLGTVGPAGDVIIAGGAAANGDHGFVIFNTAETERFRLLATGAWSVGSSGTATGTSGQVLTSNGSGAAPSWQAPSTHAETATTADDLAGGVLGNVPYQSDIGVTEFVPNGSPFQVLTSNGDAAPSWEIPVTTNVVEGTNLYWTQLRFDEAFAAKSTTDLVEGTNFYFTQARFDSALAAKTTTDVAEGTNLYYTTARFNTDFAGKTTTDLPEGTNLYWTVARFNSTFATKSTTDLVEGTNLYWTQSRFDTALAAKSTTNVAEGTNLYYTDTRARSALSLVAGISGATYTTATGVLNLSAVAPLASPDLTGVPTAPTATAGTNTTQIATTAFVTSAVAAANPGTIDGGSF